MDLHKMHISDNVNEWFSENTLSKWLYRLPVRQGWRFLIVLICFILLGISAFEGEADALQGALQDTAEAQALMLSGAYSEEESQIYDDTGLVALEEAAQELPFTDILDAQGEGITITWEGMTEADLGDLESIKTEIQSAVDAFSSEGYSTGFILRDPNSGGGISYHADELYYSASTIKGPYVAWLVQAYPETATALYGTIENTIQWSSNDDYGALIAAYGVDGFNSWAAECGCADLALALSGILGLWQKISVNFGIAYMIILCRESSRLKYKVCIRERFHQAFTRCLGQSIRYILKVDGSAKAEGHIIMCRMTQGSC